MSRMSEICERIERVGLAVITASLAAVTFVSALSLIFWIAEGGSL